MRTFETYLQSRGVKAKGISRYIYLVNKFKERHEPITTEYSDLVTYYNWLEEEQKSYSWKVESLSALRNYFTYLKATKQLEKNPTTNFKLRGKQSLLPTNLLTEDELKDIYESYPENSPERQRNKLILGLIIYQGLSLQEVENLTEKQLNLEKGTLQIPQTKKLNKRELELKAVQLIPLYKFKKERKGKVFFTSKGSSKTMNYATTKLLRYLQRESPKFNSFSQLRQSRIALWTKECELRKVQYLAGHKYISSTERYAKVYQEDLKEKVKKYHPLD